MDFLAIYNQCHNKTPPFHSLSINVQRLHCKRLLYFDNGKIEISNNILQPDMIRSICRKGPVWLIEDQIGSFGIISDYYRHHWWKPVVLPSHVIRSLHFFLLYSDFYLPFSMLRLPAIYNGHNQQWQLISLAITIHVYNLVKNQYVHQQSVSAAKLIKTLQQHFVFEYLGNCEHIKGERP